MKKKFLDVGIIVLIPVELKETLKTFGLSSSNKITAINNKFEYYYCSMRDSKGNPISVAISYITGKAGNVESSICVSNFCDEWIPKVMLLIGISAGIEGRIKIGDVLMPDKVQDITIKTYENKDFSNRASTYQRHDVINKMLHSNSTFLHPNADFSIIDGTIGSDNVLIKDSHYFTKYLLPVDESCKGGEMESAGFIRACTIENNIPWVIFRGISDFGDKKNDANHTLAAHNASLVAKLFIEKVLDISRIQRQSDFVANRYMEDYCEKVIQSCLEEEKWEDTCKLNQFASRYLLLTGQYDTRIRFGEMAKEASEIGKLPNYTSRILIDDLGWTNYLLYLDRSTEEYLETAIKNINLGISIAIQYQLFHLAAKGYRHLASINRSLGKLKATKSYLDKAEQQLTNISSIGQKEEIECDLLLSKSKYEYARFNTLKSSKAKKSAINNAINYAQKAEKMYEHNSDNERLIKTYKFLATLYISANDTEKARIYREKQEQVISKTGRVLYW